MNSLQEKNYEYYAFISYMREDDKWAKWLQNKLEYYKIPTAVRKKYSNLPKRVRPVFRDTTDLELGVLPQKIQKGLDSSKFLIVICSPRSASSFWVGKEVQSFIDSGRSEHIIPFIIEGSPHSAEPQNECFPEAIRRLKGEQELRGVNINEMGRDAAAIKVIAHMLGIRFDTLWQKFQRARRIRLLIMAAFSIFMLAMVVLMSFLYVDRNKAYDDLQVERIRLVAEDASKEFMAGEVLEAYQKIRPFIRTPHNNVPFEPTVTALLNDIALYLSNDLYKTVDVVPIANSDTPSDAFYYSPDGKWYAYGDEGRYLLYNMESQQTMQLPGAWWHDFGFSFNSAGNKLLYATYGDMHLWDLSHCKELPIEGLPVDDVTEMLAFARNYIAKNGFSKMQLLEDYNDESDLDPLSDDKGFDTFSWAASYVQRNDISLLALNEKGNEFLAKEHDGTINIYYKDTDYVTDYPFIGNVEQVFPTPYYKFLQTGKDLIVNACFLTKRSIQIMSPEISQCVQSDYGVDTSATYLEYDDNVWKLLDRKEQCELYERINSNYDDEDASDYAGGELLLINGKSTVRFTPFLGWSIGNGLSSLHSAYIIDSDNVLCLADQGPHVVYNLSKQTRRYLEENYLDLWIFGHPSVFVVASKMIDKNTVVDVRGAGVITYYDIPSGQILAEYSIPEDYIQDSRGVSDASFISDREILVIKDKSSPMLKVKIPSIEEKNEYLINELDKFWQ